LAGLTPMECEDKGGEESLGHAMKKNNAKPSRKRANYPVVIGKHMGRESAENVVDGHPKREMGGRGSLLRGEVT